PLGLGEIGGARRFDIERRPGRTKPVRLALGVADERGAVRLLVDTYENAVSGCPRTGNGVGLHVAQELVVDALGGATKREFPERGQVAGREVVLDGARRGCREIDLAFVEALDQIFRR